jgi:hypothetical protein
VTGIPAIVWMRLLRFGAMIFSVGASVRRILIGCVLQLSLILAFALWSEAGAEKLVDPNSVAPEYRSAAEKRRAEQLKLLQCSKKADDAKVARRDRAALVNECLDRHQ